jgi:lipoprotein-releasing system permease protein
MLRIFFIAQRYAQQQVKKTWVHRLSRLTCYSTALSTAVLALVVSTMNGMTHVFQALFDRDRAVLKIIPKQGKTFTENQILKTKIRQLPSVQEVVELLEERVLLQYNGIQILTTLKGVAPSFVQSEGYKQYKQIDLDAKTFFASKPKIAPAIVSNSLAKRIKTTPDCSTPLTVFYPKNQGLSISLDRFYKKGMLAVCGAFVTSSQKEDKLVLVPIGFVEQLTNRLQQRTAWELVLPEDARAQTKTMLQKLLPPELRVVERCSQNEARQKAIFVERLSVYFVFSLVVMLACLHLFFMLCILILEKQKDLSSLAAIGTTSNQIKQIFIYTGLWISAEGVCYGLGAAWLLGKLQQTFGLLTLYTLPHQGPTAYPVEMHVSDFLCIAGGTLIASLATALWPAKKAAQIAYPTKNEVCVRDLQYTKA